MLATAQLSLHRHRSEEEYRDSLAKIVTDLTGAWLQHLPVHRWFGPAAWGELVTVVLPDLARRTVVDVRSRRLPPVVRDLAPRIVLELNQIGAGNRFLQIGSEPQMIA